MQALSLWQPYASLWLTDRKIHETRHWGTQRRGWFAVQAAKRFEPDLSDEVAAIVEAEFGRNWRNLLPRGSIIGAVNLTDCLQMDRTSPTHDDDRACGHWTPTRFAWRRSDVIKLQTPIPFIGRQRIFNVPDDITNEIMNPSRAA